MMVYHFIISLSLIYRLVFSRYFSINSFPPHSLLYWMYLSPKTPATYFCFLVFVFDLIYFGFKKFHIFSFASLSYIFIDLGIQSIKHSFHSRKLFFCWWSVLCHLSFFLRFIGIEKDVDVRCRDFWASEAVY